jgi:hypothetical protein
MKWKFISSLLVVSECQDQFLMQNCREKHFKICRFSLETRWHVYTAAEFLQWNVEYSAACYRIRARAPKIWLPVCSHIFISWLFVTLMKALCLCLSLLYFEIWLYATKAEIYCINLIEERWKLLDVNLPWGKVNFSHLLPQHSYIWQHAGGWESNYCTLMLQLH